MYNRIIHKSPVQLKNLFIVIALSLYVYDLDMGDSIDNIERESEGDQDSVLNTLIKGNILSEIYP